MLGIMALLLALPAQQAWNWWQPHEDVPWGRPRPQLWQASHALHLMDPPGFVLGYSEWLRNPLWVSWQVPDGALQPLGPRPKRFSCAQGTLARVCPDDYRQSGYDRGHMAPNYAMSRLHGPKAQRASFSMANISPQKHRFNSKLWQRLEELEMDQLPRKPGQHFYVLTGPLFRPSPARLDSGVAIPEAFWRLWVRWTAPDGSDLQALAFVAEQEVPPNTDLRRLQLSVDALEERSGLDFLHLLEDAIEAKVEAQVRPEDWAPASAWTRPSRY